MINMNVGVTVTSEKYLEKQRETRLANGNKHTKKYEKTERGFLMRLYRNMQSRITGVQYLKAHLYLGKELLSREDFYFWADKHKTFKILFSEWSKANYPRRLTPSVDRIDSSKGYILSNMEWVAFHINCSRGSKKRNPPKTTVE